MLHQNRLLYRTKGWNSNFFRHADPLISAEMPRSAMMNCLHRTKTTATSQSMMAPTPATPEYLTYRQTHISRRAYSYKEAAVSAWASSPEPSTAAVAAAAAAATVQDETDVVTILERAKAAMSAWLGPSRQVKWSPPHLLDMRDGHSGIRAHVDYVEASGSVIGGLCLLSPAVVVFRNQNDPERDYFKALLPARCLYMQA
ncbi:hypothetical protein BSLG_001689 [Batrachochytrium salamandrivorans]|nr:hypothetical protein BSLG_001689 [Batrachochytrium salamandrivorans]